MPEERPPVQSENKTPPAQNTAVAHTAAIALFLLILLLVYFSEDLAPGSSYALSKFIAGTVQPKLPK